MAVYIFILLAVCVLDQLTKLYAVDLIAATYHVTASEVTVGMSREIIPGVLHFSYLENPGMSFGLLAEHRWVFMVLSIVGIAALGGFLFAEKGKDKLLSTALALTIGGGIGNMFDRVLLRYVIDFIDVSPLLPFWHWTFNVADSAVCIGAVLLCIAVLKSELAEKKKK